MENSRILDCEYIRKHLKAFVNGRCEGDMEEFREHLSKCADCQDEYEVVLEYEIFEGNVKLSIPSGPYPAFIEEKLREPEPVDILWDFRKQWEMPEKETAVFVTALGVILSSIMVRRVFEKLDMLGELSETIEILDINHKPSGEKIKLKIEKEPGISPAGKFTAKYSTDDKKVKNKTLLLTLKHWEKGKITFIVPFEEEDNKFSAFLYYETPLMGNSYSIPEENIEISIWCEEKK